MVISHNLAAMNQSHQLRTNTKKTADSSRKLSSGYRINEDADDAAGLTISEAMRHQVRGLDRASSNVQDGISMVQTADAALEETQQILDRMEELAVQAANDINTEADRSAIQEEIDQIKKEIDHIAYDTNFNQQYMLAEGTPKARPGYFKIQTGSLANQSVTINFVNASKESLGVDTVDVSSYEKASESISKIQNAIELAGSWRNEFGSVQEQLEHATKAVDNTSENTQRAESGIRDTDMNEELVKFTTNKILVNAAQSLLAQYNRRPETVLTLLK
ncbi:MAG: flagellin [Roseburia sp.]|nr:flagellin [Roseburia sp.]